MKKREDFERLLQKSRQKKVVDIERLLQWAYREELPKQSIGGLTGWEKLVYLGTMVDEGRGDSQFPVALGPPHPDALLIDYAVRGLEDVAIDWRASRTYLMGDLAQYIPDDIAVKRMRAQPSALIMLHAKMATRPRWDLGQPLLVPVKAKNGKPMVQFLEDGVLVDGMTRGRRYGYMARCPLRLDPPAQEIACARFEYAAWHAALVKLANESWTLADHAPQQPRAPAEPWHSGEEPRPRILRTIAARQKPLTLTRECA